MRFNLHETHVQRQAVIAHALLALRYKLGKSEFSPGEIAIILFGASVMLVDKIGIELNKLFPFKQSAGMPELDLVLEHFASANLVERKGRTYVFLEKADAELYDYARPAKTAELDLIELQATFTALVHGWSRQRAVAEAA